MKYISMASYLMYAWGAIVAFPELIRRTENVVSNIGLGLFLFGIGLTLEGFKDYDEFTKAEIKRYSNPGRIKVTLTINVLLYLISIVIGIMMFNLRMLYPGASSEVLSQFKDIGYGSLAIGIGGLSIVKQQYMRMCSFVEQLKKT